jgi:hypothetical protein
MIYKLRLAIAYAVDFIGDDVECLEDCTVHKCVDCGHTLTSTDVDICCYGEECID